MFELSLWDVGITLLAYAYVMAVIGISEVLRKKRGLPTSFTRRMIHLFAGDSVLLLPLFTHYIYPVILVATLAVMVFLSFTYLKSSFITLSMVEKGDEVLHAYGPVYYIISVLILVIIFWPILGREYTYIAMASTMVMAWGDGVASLIPKKLRKVHRYPFSNKSLEGSLSMFLGAFLGALFALFIASLFPYTLTSPLSLERMLTLALVAAATGTLVEAFTLGPIRHFDNFTVPFSVALVLYLLS